MTGPGISKVECAVCHARFAVEQATLFDVDLAEPYYTAACPGCIDTHYRKSIRSFFDENEEAVERLLEKCANDNDPQVATAATAFLAAFQNRNNPAAEMSAALN